MLGPPGRKLLLPVTVAIGLLLTAGCAWPPRAAQPQAVVGSDRHTTGAAAVTLRVRLATGGRRLQFNGGEGALQNDIDKLVVGLFDNGTAAVHTLGYRYAGAVAASPVASAVSASVPGYLWSGSSAVSALLGTAGTGDAPSGLAITADRANPRRYLLYEVGGGSGFASGQSEFRFHDIPAADGDRHDYLAFAAAYDSAGEHLGYAETAVPAASVQGAQDAAAPELTLRLRQGVFTPLLSESAKLNPFTPAGSSSQRPQLFAVYPPVASAGSTVWLEGRFAGASGSALGVEFPGAGTVAGMVVGPGRAKVTVPAGATAGDLRALGLANSERRPFRGVSFSLGIGAFGERYEQAGAVGRTMPALRETRYASTAAVIGDYVYVIGGLAAGVQSTVERGLIYADGTLGPFETLGGVSLVRAREWAASAVVGDYLYVVGGFSPWPVQIASVERARIDADGGLGPFETYAGSALSSARGGHELVALGSNLYAVGGQADQSPLGSVDGAQIGIDGSLGPFASVPGVSLSTPRSDHALAMTGDYLYVAGGYGPNFDLLATVERSPINPDGTLAGFEPVAGVSLQAARAGAASAVLGDRFVVLGGGRSGAPIASVEQARIAADGTLGAFSSAGALRTPRYGLSWAVAGSRLYAIGGEGLGAYLRSIEQAPVNASGNLGPFAVAPGVAFADRWGHEAVSTGNYLHLLGGVSQTILRARVASDGTVGAMEQAGSIVTYRDHLAAVVAGPYVYLIGGLSNSARIASVERAPINADGTLGAFGTVAGSALATARSDHAAQVVGSNVYVIGGYDGATSLTTIEVASLDGAGNLGTFVATASLPAPRGGHSCAVLGNWLYVVGGGGLASVMRAPINADGTLGPFGDAGVSLTAQRSDSVAAVVGPYLYVTAGSTDGSLNGVLTVERAPIAADGTLGPFSVVPGLTLANPRIYATAAVLGNYLYVLGGYGSGAGNADRAMLQ